MISLEFVSWENAFNSASCCTSVDKTALPLLLMIGFSVNSPVLIPDLPVVHISAPKAHEKTMTQRNTEADKCYTIGSLGLEPGFSPTSRYPSYAPLNASLASYSP